MTKILVVAVMMLASLFTCGCPGGQTTLTIDDINRISYGTMYAAGYASVVSHKIDPAILDKAALVMDAVQTLTTGLTATDGGIQAAVMPFLPSIVAKAGITDPAQSAAIQAFAAIVLKAADEVAAKYPDIVKQGKNYASIVCSVVQGARAGINDASKFNSKAPLPKS